MITTPYSNILTKNTLYHNNLGISAIPEAVFEHPKLEKLDLSYNNITELEERIGDLKALKYLDLSNNKLQQLPASFAQLQALEVLVLSNNQWAAFPAVITQLTQLKILKIKGKKIKKLPAAIGQLRSLEQLDLGFNPIEDLPMELGELRQLRELICTSNHFAHFPEVLLEMEQLEHLEKLDLDFRLKLPIKSLRLFFKVLRQLKKQKATWETKKAAFQIFLEQDYKGERSPVIPLLLINYVEFAQVVRSYIVEHYTQKITANSKIAVLGKTEWIDLDALSTDLEITRAIEPTTTDVVLGRQISKQQLESLPDGLGFLSEKMLLAYLSPKQPADWVKEHRGKLIDLLRSAQNENISLALQLAKDSDLLDELLTELLLAYTQIDSGNLVLRNELKAIFYLRIPNFEQLTLPGPSFKFYTPHKSEHAIFQGIKNITNQTPKWDGLRLASYLFEEYRVAYTYILAYSSMEAEKKWLEQFVEGDTIYLGTLTKLKKLPKSLVLFPQLRVLNLQGCGFRKFPNVDLLFQLPNLEQIDLRKNPISFIPRALFKQIAAYRVLLTTK